MDKKTCCVTGHRNIPAERIAYVEQELRREVQAAIEDGYTRFISGFAEGADLMFAAIVAEQKEHNPDLFWRLLFLMLDARKRKISSSMNYCGLVTGSR